MKDLSSRQKRNDFVVAYIQSGEKERTDFKVGIEFEHFVIDEKTKVRRSYYEDGGVRDILERIAQLDGMTGIYEGDNILGISAQGFDISIEPGAQFEISVERQNTVNQLQEEYREALAIISPVFHELGAGLLTLGLDPVTTIDNIPLIPKKRYEVMDSYLSQQGIHARTMMRQSCALQIAIDYSNPDDFKRKFRVASALSPILYTLFDNTAYYEGEKVVHFNMRQKVWRNMDNDRSGLIPHVFDADFSYDTYADWLLDVPILFIPAADGSIEETGRMTLNEALANAKTQDEADRIMEHGLSIVFPDVRAKRYIELRQMDEVPSRFAYGAAAMLKGIFYNAESLEKLDKYFAEISEDLVERGKNSGSDNGIQGYYFSKYFAQWGLELLDLAEKGIEEEEKRYLEDLRKLWDNLDTPRLLFERVEEEEGFNAAITAFQVIF